MPKYAIPLAFAEGRTGRIAYTAQDGIVDGAMDANAVDQYPRGLFS